MLYLVNTAILTNYGSFKFEPLALEYAKELLEKGFVSGIGHSATAKLMEELLDIPIPCERTVIQMAEGDIAVVFRLSTRLPEGLVIT